MTREEIEKVIKNGESVWFSYNNSLFELCKDSTARIVFKDFTSFLIGNYKINRNGISIKVDDNNFNREYFYDTEINNFYKTKAEAEHYLNHANVSRVEQLPFLTWEEFVKERYFGFYTHESEYIGVYITNSLYSKELIITIENETQEKFINNYELTEANFYKAYDECVRLFRGEE